jgi:hypothetical protein
MFNGDFFVVVYVPCHYMECSESVNSSKTQ